MTDTKFITEEQRNKLRDALSLVKNVCGQITYDYEEYFILITTMGAIRDAIECEEKYF